jgi:hypothetical protein
MVVECFRFLQQLDPVSGLCPAQIYQFLLR